MGHTVSKTEEAANAALASKAGAKERRRSGWRSSSGAGFVHAENEVANVVVPATEPGGKQLASVAGKPSLADTRGSQRSSAEVAVPNGENVTRPHCGSVAGSFTSDALLCPFTTAGISAVANAAGISECGLPYSHTATTTQSASPVSSMLFSSQAGYPHNYYELGPPTSDHEQERVQALRSLQILDSVASGRQGRMDEEIQMVLGLVTQVFRAPIALVALFDDSRIVVRGSNGPIPVGDFPWRWSLCAYTMSKNVPQTLVIPDTSKDARFADNPFVKDDPGIRFYCGAPLLAASGHILGTLCFADWTARPSFDAASCMLMNNLAEMLVRQLERLRPNVAPEAVVDSETKALSHIARTLECYETITGLVDVRSKGGWTLMYCNEAWEGMVNQRRNLLVGRPLQQMLGLDVSTDPRVGTARCLAAFAAGVMASRSEWEAYAAALLQGEAIDGITVRVLNPDGTPTNPPQVMRMSIRPANTHVVDAAVRMPLGIPSEVSMSQTGILIGRTISNASTTVSEGAAVSPFTEAERQQAGERERYAGPSCPWYCFVTLEPPFEHQSDGGMAGQRPGSSLSASAPCHDPGTGDAAAASVPFSAQVHGFGSPVCSSTGNAVRTRQCGQSSSRPAPRHADMPTGCEWSYGMEPLPGLRLGYMLGKGGFGRVFLSTYRGKRVAAKVVSNAMLRDVRCLNGVTLEAILGQELAHPFIVHTVKCVVRAYGSNGLGGSSAASCVSPRPSPAQRRSRPASTTMAATAMSAAYAHRVSQEGPPTKAPSPRMSVEESQSALPRGRSVEETRKRSTQMLQLDEVAVEDVQDLKAGLGCGSGAALAGSGGYAGASCSMTSLMQTQQHDTLVAVVADTGCGAGAAGCGNDALQLADYDNFSGPGWSMIDHVEHPKGASIDPSCHSAEESQPASALNGGLNVSRTISQPNAIGPASTQAAAGTSTPTATPQGMIAVVQPMPPASASCNADDALQPHACMESGDSFMQGDDFSGSGVCMIDQLGGGGGCDVGLPVAASVQTLPSREPSGADNEAPAKALRPQLSVRASHEHTAATSPLPHLRGGQVRRSESSATGNGAANEAAHIQRGASVACSDLMAAASCSLDGFSAVTGAGNSVEKLPPLDGETWILQEYCTRGTLQEAIDTGLLRTQRSRVTGQPAMQTILVTAQEVASAMAYVHARGFMHGDLSAVNVLLTDADGNIAGPNEKNVGRGWVAKVSDFGLAKHQPDPQAPYISSTFGVITHCAPEVLKSYAQSQKADVYSFGVLLWQMYTSSRPWANMNRFQILGAVTSETSPGLRFHPGNKPPKRYYDLTMRCLSYDPSKRPTFSEVCEELRLTLLELIAGTTASN